MLSDYEEQGKYVNLSLSSHLADSLDASERDFLTALLYTSVEHKLTYDYYIGALSERSPDKIDTYTRNILRIGMCQIIDMDKIPDFAAVNETVKLARNSGERSFVNALLRSVIRNKDALPMPKRKKNAARYLSVRYSFPLWTVKKFIEWYGEEGAEALLSSYNKIQPTDLTVNTSKITRAHFIQKLIALGYKAEASLYSDISLRIYGSVDPKELPGFECGEFFIQDAACAAAISKLSPQENEALVDVCACPGGKSFAAAVLMNGKGHITSYDIHESKIPLITNGAQRLGISLISASVCDATVGDKAKFYSADRVICDVPCSGLGVLGKKPDLRYKSAESMESLPSIQLSILKTSANYLKPGGRLLYSTCTLNPDENVGVVEKFLSETGGFHTVDFEVGGFKSQHGSFTFVPHIHNTDGFFMSLIEKDNY